MRPIRIGISSCIWEGDPHKKIFNGRRIVYLEESLGHFFMRKGVMAFLIPSPSSVYNDFGDYIQHIDGLVLQGGVDVAPGSYSEKVIKSDWQGDAERDLYELNQIGRAHV